MSNDFTTQEFEELNRITKAILNKQYENENMQTVINYLHQGLLINSTIFFEASVHFQITLSKRVRNGLEALLASCIIENERDIEHLKEEMHGILSRGIDTLAQ